MGVTSAKIDEPKAPAKGGIVPDLSRWRTKIADPSAIYWMGVLPLGNGRHKPPMHSIDAPTVTFEEWWTPAEGRGQDGSDRRGQYAGRLIRLSSSRVERIREFLRSSLVRWRVREGAGAYGYVVRIPDGDNIDALKAQFGLADRDVSRLRTRATLFEPKDDDEPVAKYVYCVKVDHPEAKDGGKFRPSTQFPPSVLDAGEIPSP